MIKRLSTVWIAALANAVPHAAAHFRGRWVSLMVASGFLSVGGTYGAVHYQNLHTFADGTDPTVIAGKDGALYGTYISGAFTAEATAHIFTIQPDGTAYKNLVDFDIATYPLHGLKISPLLEGTDGVLYGQLWTTGNGVDQSGLHHVIFSLSKTESIFRLLYEERAPPLLENVALLEGDDGALYGASSLNLVFSLEAFEKNGGGYTVIHSFEDDETPFLSLRSGHVLYGTTYDGGSQANASGVSGLGALFAVNEDGSGYRVLHTFGGAGDGGNPGGGLVEGVDGALYGMTAASVAPSPVTGAAGGPTIFKLNKDGNNYRILHIFDSGVVGDVSECTLANGGNGRLYGTTPFGGADPAAGDVNGSIFRLNEDGSGYTILYSFGRIPTDGVQPMFGVVRGNDGAFYGTTA